MRTRRPIFPWLLTTLLLITGCATSPKAGSTYIHSEAEGHGLTCTDALNQAKIIAADRASGSFVYGQRSLVNNTDYSERIHEYSGATIRRYKILATNGSEPCTVKIWAELIPDKKNSAIPQGGKAIQVDDVKNIANKQRYNTSFMSNLVRQPSMFSVKIDNLTVRAQSTGDVLVEFDIVSIKASPKWYSDLESYLSIHAQQEVFEAESSGSKFSKGLWSLASLGTMAVLPYAGTAMTLGQAAVTKKLTNVADAGLCMPSNKTNRLHCYKSDQQAHIIQYLNGAYLEVLTVKDGIAYSRAPVSNYQFSLIEYIRFEDPLQTASGLTGSHFLVIKPHRPTQKVVMHFEDNKLPDGGIIEVRVGFK